MERSSSGLRRIPLLATIRTMDDMMPDEESDAVSSAVLTQASGGDVPPTLMFHDTHLLTRLSQAQTPLQEYHAKRDILKQHVPLSEVLLFRDWHCLPQACSVLRPMLTHDADSDIRSWLVNPSHFAGNDCPSNVHCGCHTVSLMTQLPMDEKLLALFDQLMTSSSSCIKKECFLTSCLLIVHKSVDSSDPSDQERKQMMQRLNRLWQLLPRIGSNFVGEVVPNSVSSCVRWLIVTFLTIVASDSSDESWRRQQLFNLRHMIAEAAGNSETGDNATKQIIQVFGEEDVKLISVTKIMICILRDLSESTAAQEVFQEFANAIHLDHKVLVDWMMSEEETAVQLLSLLLTYLKLPNDGISESVRMMLVQLRDSWLRLRSKGLAPYEAEPLMRLMRSL